MLTWLSIRKSTLDLHTADHEIPRSVSDALSGAGVPILRKAIPRLTAEFARARRHERALSLTVFKVGAVRDSSAPGCRDVSATDAGERAASRQDPFCDALLGSVLRDATRDTDVVTYAAALGCCIVLMPETDAARARDAARRLREVWIRRVAVPLRVCVVSFPEDGWTLEELIRRVTLEQATATQGATLSHCPEAAGS